MENGDYNKTQITYITIQYITIYNTASEFQQIRFCPFFVSTAENVVCRSYGNINYFLIKYLIRVCSKCMSSNIFRKAADSRSKTPSALIDKFINFTDGISSFVP